MANKKQADNDLKRHLNRIYRGTDDRAVKKGKKIIPLGDRYYIRQFQENTNQAVVIPDRAEQEKKAQGIIEEVGDGEKVAKMNIKKGDTVIYGMYSGDLVQVDGDKNQYLLVESDMILAKIV
jgi:chaperonin GroES